MTEKSAKLAGKVALVTGASHGIGEASALELARDGAAVVLMGRTADALARAKAGLEAAVPGARVEMVTGDALSVADFERAVDVARGITGTIDIVVSTIGGGGFKPLLMQDVDGLRNELDLNITSAFIAMRYSAPHMPRGGSIVCISSTAGVTAFPWLSAYCAGKAGLEGLIRTAADELSYAGIRVNAVRPGMTKSNATAGMFDAKDVIDGFIEQIPLQRTGVPSDIGQAVRFLAGPESGWMTGQSFAVDGGHELRRNPDLSPMVAHVFGEDAFKQVLAGQSPGGQ